MQTTYRTPTGKSINILHPLVGGSGGGPEAHILRVPRVERCGHRPQRDATERSGLVTPHDWRNKRAETKELERSWNDTT